MLYVLKVFQTALQWLVHLTKLSKHHWCLWIKRCTWPHVTVMLSHTFPICSPVLTCVNSCKNTLLAEEIIEAQWYFLILNLYTCIPYCLFLTLYTLTSIYMHILHTFLCVLTRRICSTVKSFLYLKMRICSTIKVFFVSALIYGWHCMANLVTTWGFRIWQR